MQICVVQMRTALKRASQLWRVQRRWAARRIWGLPSHSCKRLMCMLAACTLAAAPLGSLGGPLSPHSGRRGPRRPAPRSCISCCKRAVRGCTAALHGRLSSHLLPQNGRRGRRRRAAHTCGAAHQQSLCSKVALHAWRACSSSAWALTSTIGLPAQLWRCVQVHGAAGLREHIHLA